MLRLGSAPPGLFTRSSSAPKTVPPPLPLLSRSGVSITSSISGSGLSLSTSQSLSNPSLPSRFSTSHSRQSSASSLAPVDEDRYHHHHHHTDDRPPPLTIEESKEPAPIHEQGEDEDDEDKDEGDEEGQGGQRGPARDEEKTLDEDDQEEDEDEGDDEEGEEEEEEEEADGEGEVDYVRPMSREIPPSPMSVSRAFAIFGREIRHVSPNTSLSLSLSSIPPPPPSTFSKKTPRTVPPPLPGLSSAASRPPVHSLHVPSTPSATADLASPHSPVPFSPLLTPTSPVTPASPPVVPAISPHDSHSSIPSLTSSPHLLPLTAPTPPPALSDSLSTSRKTSSASPPSRSAASSVTQPSHPSSSPSTHPPPLKVRSSLPAGFQFPTGKFHAKAAPAAAGAAMSASSPMPASVGGVEGGGVHAATAPPGLGGVEGAASGVGGTTSEPTTPRRGVASTVCTPLLVRDAAVEALVRPATAGPRSEDGGAVHGRGGASGAVPLVAISEGSAVQKQKCSKCVAFSVRGEYCFKHLYHAGLSALAAPTSPPTPLPRLSQTLHPSSASSTSQMLRIADELLKTEKSYYESLRVAYRSFQLRLQVAASFADHPQELTSGLMERGSGGKGGEAKGVNGVLSLLPVLKAEEIGTIFSKLHDIFTLSSNLYHDLTTLNSIRVQLDSALEDGNGAAQQPAPTLTLLLPFLGATLLHYSSYFRVYQSYLENYDDAIKLLVQLRSSSPVLDVWLMWQEKCEGMSLDSLLIMPVQRLPRYLLLLQEIIKSEEKLIDLRRSSPHTGGLFAHYPLGYSDILTAREKISRIADAINSSLHQKESAQEVAHLQSLFDHTDSHFVPFATPTRQLIKQGVLKKINETRKNHFLNSTSTYAFFLLNDLFVYAEESKKLGGVTRYRMKNTIPLLDLTLMEGEGVGARELKMRNEGSGKQLTVQCKSGEERDEWRCKIEEMQTKLKDLTNSMHVLTFDGTAPQLKKERSNKAKLIMGIGG